MRLFLTVISLAALLGVLPAAAAPDKDVPKDAIGSGAITLQQMSEGLQFLTAQKEGVVVNFVLPDTWELVEEGIDAKTGKVKEDLNVYSLLSRRPVADPRDATDFIFELDIYKHGLMEGAKADPKTGQPPEAKDQFKSFLDLQMSINIKAGLKVLSKPNEIVPKLYGPPSRPRTVFVPIYYETPQGALLYTFTSVAGQKVWQLKFLVSKDQVENYGALIALMLDNAFGLTEQEYKDLLKNSPGDGAKPAGK